MKVDSHIMCVRECVLDSVLVHNTHLRKVEVDLIPVEVGVIRGAVGVVHAVLCACVCARAS